MRCKAGLLILIVDLVVRLQILKTDLVTYASPLPAAADRVSCDGQGVYILSDGQPTDKTDSTLNSVMNASLNSTTFNCSASGALSSTRDWHCMSNYAKKLLMVEEFKALLQMQPTL